MFRLSNRSSSSSLPLEQRHQHHLEEDISIMSSSWGFYSNISGTEADSLLLKHGEYGSFICRRSGTTPGAYTLSVRRHKDVIHFKIYNNGECFNIYGEDEFASVPELIQFYRSGEGDFLDDNREPVDLIQPLHVQTSAAPLQQERWFYGCIGKEETKQMLLKNGSPGSFLIRESQSRPGNYVLSVRIDQDTVEFLVVQNGGKFDLSTAKGFKFPSLHDLISHYQKNPIVHGQTNQSICISKPLSITAEERRSDGVMKLEFERLQQLDKVNPASKNEGRRPENKAKNRYKNILPFDHTRVKLRNGDPLVIGSDYINANYITDDVTGKVYIASQGCMQSNILDFWEMIYQENCRIIIMLTNEVEKGKIKCVRYWPDVGSILFYGDKTVANVNETSTRDYFIRELHVTRQPKDMKGEQKFILTKSTVLHINDIVNQENSDLTAYVQCEELWGLWRGNSDGSSCCRCCSPVWGSYYSASCAYAGLTSNVKQTPSKGTGGPAKPPRKIYFYHYTEWPDHGVPSDPGSLLQMLQDADNKEKQSFEKPGPPIIHCSAGIGRTGTVVVVDMLINQLRLKSNLNSIDVQATVQQVRNQRSGMVQTEIQYKFIYSVINHYTEVERKLVSLQRKEQLYSNINDASRESSRGRSFNKKKDTKSRTKTT